MKNKLIFLDTETTGRDEEDRLCEIAFKKRGDKSWTEVFKPPLPIKLEAMAIHHITEKMAADKKPLIGSEMHHTLKEYLEDGHVMIAHNSQFDVKMLQKEGINPKNVICTMKVGRHLDVKDEMSSYSMQYMRHWFDIEADVYEHSAKGDIHILEKLFEIFEKQISIEEMIKITKEPALLRKITFGKHKGEKFAKIPLDYLMWLRRQDDLGEDLLHTINHWIQNR